MPRFCTLASSSQGNCIYIGNADEGILIDAGISNKKICDGLNALNVDENSIKAVFVTHEHSDHVSGLRVFSEKHNVKIYATGGTLAALNDSGKITDKMITEKLPVGKISIGNISVEYFSTSHDARQSCGYIVEIDGTRVGICTDNGYMNEEIISKLSDCYLCLLESNYDEDRLRYGSYSSSLKNRIRSPKGHLSNDNCAETVLYILKNGSCRHFVLGHLSPENNTPELARSCTNSLLKRYSYAEGIDYTLRIAPVGTMDRLIRW